MAHDPGDDPALLPLHPVAAWMLLPYLLWVAFAGALNFAIWRLNRAGGVA